MERGYYAVITAEVRYDKRLKPNEKLLYGEITALCNERGYCWAKNDYFADLYEVRKDTISGWISNLVKCGYLKRELIYKKDSKEISERRLYLTVSTQEITVTSPINKVDPIVQKEDSVSDKKHIPSQTNIQDPIVQKAKDNNTSINNTSINNTFNTTVNNKKEKEFLLFEEMWKLYPNKKGKAAVTKKAKENVEKLGAEVFIQAINNYLLDVENQRKNGFTSLEYVNGSTFFNSRYEDYLTADNITPLKLDTGNNKNSTQDYYNKVDSWI